MTVEEERKYQVDPSFALPDLTGCLPPGGELVAGEPVTLTATYYDTADLRLARAGASLRYRREARPGRSDREPSAAEPADGNEAGPGRSDREPRAAEPADGRGDQQPWTVKLPTGAPGIRHEISRPGRPGTPPDELVALVTATTRGAPLAPAATIRSRRFRYELRDADGTVLAELADDTVSVLEERRVRKKFREVEVERIDGDRELLDRVGEVLTGAGATTGTFTAKYVRALGSAAAAPPDAPPPAPLPRQPRGADVVTEAIRASVARILGHDPPMRLRETLPDGDTPVHQLRVGCRRLRSDLRTFGPLVDAQWEKRLRRELRWLAGTLSAARDAEVLRERLQRTAADPLVPVDASAVARIDAELAARQGEALDAIGAALASDRYRALLELLVDAAQRPRLTPLAVAAAREVLPRLVAGPWRVFAYGERGVDGAADLAPHAPDDDWHAVRVSGKRARYAVEAVAAAIGGEVPRLSRRLAAVQDLLGEHQDAAIAAQTWLDIAGAEPDDHTLAVAAGRLYERERASIRRVRAEFPEAWQRASRPKLTAWLP